MNSYKFLNTVVIIALILSRHECSAALGIKWDKLIYLCGSDLSRFTSRFCDYIEDVDHGRVINTYSQAKKTDDECCEKACTVRFIFENYCTKQNLDLSQDMVISTTSSTTTSTTTSTTEKSLLPPGWFLDLKVPRKITVEAGFPNDA